jgi:hypothetical protein
MVNVQMGKGDGTQGEILFGKEIKHGGSVVRRIEDDSIRTVVDDMAIRFKSAKRQGDDRHESLL